MKQAFVKQVKDRYKKATPPLPRCIEHPRPNRPAAKWKAREGPPRFLPSPVCHLQPRPAFPRSSRRDIFALRPASLACISSSVSASLALPTRDQGLRNSCGNLAMFAAIRRASSRVRRCAAAQSGAPTPCRHCDGGHRDILPGGGIIREVECALTVDILQV